MPGLCPNGHVVQPAQRYCTICGIGLLGLGRGPLALPPGPDPGPPPREVDHPPEIPTAPPLAPPAPIIRSPGSHRPGSTSPRRRRLHRRSRRSFAVVVAGIANLVLVGGAGFRRRRVGGRARASVRGGQTPVGSA
jgi:hypothetical protein